jgi:hypothetical protein
MVREVTNALQKLLVTTLVGKAGRYLSSAH